MEELVAKKMALAELSENHSRLKRDLHRRSERDKVRLAAVPCPLKFSQSPQIWPTPQLAKRGSCTLLIGRCATVAQNFSLSCAIDSAVHDMLRQVYTASQPSACHCADGCMRGSSRLADPDARVWTHVQPQELRQPPSNPRRR